MILFTVRHNFFKIAYSGKEISKGKHFSVLLELTIFVVEIMLA